MSGSQLAHPHDTSNPYRGGVAVKLALSPPEQLNDQQASQLLARYGPARSCAGKLVCGHKYAGIRRRQAGGARRGLRRLNETFMLRG